MNVSLHAIFRKNIVLCSKAAQQWLEHCRAAQVVAVQLQSVLTPDLIAACAYCASLGDQFDLQLQIRPEQTAQLFFIHATALGHIAHLVIGNAADVEVHAVRVAEVEAADARRW